jgi:hypothetical protein
MTQDPLVESYLADLDRALTDVDPTERAEVLASIRDHLVQSLGDGDHDPIAVTTVLEQLGPVERIAAEARGGEAHPVAGGRTGWLRVQGGVLLGAAVFSLVTLFFLPLIDVPLAIAIIVVAIVCIRRRRLGLRLYWAAAAIGVLTLIVAAIAAAGLLAYTSTTVTNRPSQITTQVPAPVATQKP